MLLNTCRDYKHRKLLINKYMKLIWIPLIISGFAGIVGGLAIYISSLKKDVEMTEHELNKKILAHTLKALVCSTIATTLSDIKNPAVTKEDTKKAIVREIAEAYDQLKELLK